MSSTPAKQTPLPRRGGRSHRASRGHGSATPYLFILPALTVYGLFLLYPLGKAAWLSTYQWDGLGVGTPVGWANYHELLTDDDLRAAFAHALVLIAFYAVLPLVIGLLLAAVLNRAKVRGLSFFRTVFFIPQVIALVVAATAWRSIYALDGPINAALRTVGLESLMIDWLGDYTFALPAIGMVGTWIEIGLVTVLLLAGMGRISHDLYEAARLDGAGAIREFFAVTLPSVRGEIAVALTLTVVAALKTFDLVYMTTRGGPGKTTTVPSYEVFQQAFLYKEVGVASAIGITLTVLIFAINLVINRIADRAEA